MSSILLGDQPFLHFAFLNAGLLLFGLLMCLYGASLTLTLLLKRQPDLYRVLTGVLIVQLMLLLGVVMMDLFGVTIISTSGGFESFSLALSTHRWLLIQLPFLLLSSSIISLLVFREKLSNRPSTSYRWLTIGSVWLSCLVIVLIGLESLM